MNEVFRHFRYYEQDDLTPLSRGGLTVLFDKTNIEKGFIEVSYAKCNQKDNFCRKIGRAIAHGRKEKGMFYKIPYVKNSYKQSFEIAFPDLFTENLY